VAWATWRVVVTHVFGSSSWAGSRRDRLRRPRRPCCGRPP